MYTVFSISHSRFSKERLRNRYRPRLAQIELRQRFESSRRDFHFVVLLFSPLFSLSLSLSLSLLLSTILKILRPDLDISASETFKFHGISRSISALSSRISSNSEVLRNSMKRYRLYSISYSYSSI